MRAPSTPRRAARSPAREAERDVYHAIAEGTRRAILALLAERGDLAVGAIADRFPVSRPAISKHLAVLRKAGLVRERQEGRERRYDLVPAPLTEVVAWVGRLDDSRRTRVDALGAQLDGEEG